MTPCGPEGRHRGSSPGSLGDDPRVPRHSSALWPHGLHTRHHWKEIKWLRGPIITGGIVDREKRTKTSEGKAGGTRLCAQVDVGLEHCGADGDCGVRPRHILGPV